MPVNELFDVDVPESHGPAEPDGPKLARRDKPTHGPLVQRQPASYLTR